MNQNPKHSQGSALITFIGGIVIVVAVLFLLVKLASSGYYSNVSDMTPSAVETRIQPLGRVTMGDGTPVGQRTGEQIFNKVCIQCHGADKNVAFAPKVEHNDQWAPRIAKGFATLIQHATQGFTGPDGGQMPARGGDTSLTDDEVARAIAYMANKSGGNFTPPAIKAEDTAASDAATSGAANSSANAGDVDGKAVFESLCITCHGADSTFPVSPKVTHNDQWAPRIAKGRETLLQHALHGFNTMPAKGGNANLSDAEVEAAMVYMVNQSGGKF